MPIPVVSPVSGESLFETMNSRVSSRQKELMLYYLFMMADDNVSYSEEKIFDAMCKELDYDEDSKKSIIVICKGLADEAKDILNDVIVKEGIDEKNWGQTKNIRIIWNLINLGYADSAYSTEEKRIVEHLVNKWEIKSDLYQEFNDIAETALALTKHKEWILSNYQQDSARDEKEKKLDTEIVQILSDVELMIEELEV